MKASFIIGFHTSRLDNLWQTLRFLQKWHAEVIAESELILVCQNKCNDVAEYSGWGSQHLFNLNLKNMSLPYVTNFGVNKSNSDKLVILESDRILPSGYYAEILDQLKEGIQITTKTMKHLCDPVDDDEIVSNDFEFNWDDRDEIGGPGKRNMWSGNTALMKKDFIKAGHMDEKYIGYGWADCDMTFAMRKSGIESIFNDYHELHLWHPKTTYGEGDQHKQFVENGIRFINKWKLEIPDWFKKDFQEHKKRFLI